MSIVEFLNSQLIASKLQTDYWEKNAIKLNINLFDYIMQHNKVCQYHFAKAASSYFNHGLVTLNSSYPLHELQPYQTAHEETHELVLVQNVNDNLLNIIITNPEHIKICHEISLKIGKKNQIYFAVYKEIMAIYHLVAINHIKENLRKTEINVSAKNIIKVLISNAIHKNASDIHFEPEQLKLNIRIRIDGILNNCITIPNIYNLHIINLLKTQSNLDISIKKTPQDGRLLLNSFFGINKEARISTYPLLYGEKIVIRLLDNHTRLRSIENLGLSTYAYQILKRSIQKSQGLILITGPTGSGKSITLYSLLQERNNQSCNIVTIEDPIEIKISGINQSSINPNVGLNFSQALRAILRQDPDIIMIGEIRDKETAQIALRASQTGHLVLSTLHTNSAAEAIPRLVNMGLSPLQILQSTSLIVAQRLARKLCQYCKREEYFEKDKQNKYTKKLIKTFSPIGCIHCSNGFSGRVGIFETININESIKQLSTTNSVENNIPQLKPEKKLWDAGIDHVNNGNTTISELHRVISYDE